jgi:glycosyltransferase involved in cell wall biosynthesis
VEGINAERRPAGLPPSTLTDLAVSLALTPSSYPGADRARAAILDPLLYWMARVDTSADTLELARGVLELFHRSGTPDLLDRIEALVEALARAAGSSGMIPARRGHRDPAGPVPQSRFVWLAAQIGQEARALAGARHAFRPLGADGSVAVERVVEAHDVHEALFKLTQVTSGAMQIPLWRGGTPAPGSRSRPSTTHGEARGDVPRVALLSREPTGHACPYLRLHSPLAALSASGEIELSHPAGINRRYVLLDPEPVLDADVIVTQRFFPVGLFEPAVMPVLARTDAARIHDLDDLITDLPPGHPREGEVDAELYAVRACLLGADLVTTPSPVLADALRAEGIEAVRVIPNAIDPADWPGLDPATRPDGGDGRSGPPVRIGWVGTSTHGPDLELVVPAFRALLERFGSRIEIELRGIEAPASLAADPRLIVRPDYEYDYRRYASDLATSSFDLAVVPLRDHPFNRAKSAIKWLEWSAVGVAGVYADLPPYADVVEPGHTGFLAGSDPEEWTAILTALVTDPRRRRDAATAAWTAVRSTHTVTHTRALWLEALAEARDRRRAREARTVRSTRPRNPIPIPIHDLVG